MRPDDGGGSSNYSSIQFSGMASLISEVRSAGTTLQDTARSLQSEASGCGVSSPAFAQIIEIGSWAESQVAGLQRRLTLAKGAAALIEPGLDGWTIDEPVDMTEGQASAKGAALAQKILDHNRTDSDFIKLTDDALDQLKLYQGDPDVLSGFYAKLGPQMTQLMPSLLEGSGAQDTTQLQKLSQTFALAFNDPDPPQGFTDVTELFKTSTGHEPDPTNWDRLAMLQWGHFPPDFVADVVRANGLQKFADGDDENVDWRGRMNGALGLDGDVRTLIFGALKDNPEGTRDAFNGLDLDHVVDATYAEGSFDFELQQNFIAAMKAGAGVDDETMGDHSDAASRFAFDFIRASASNKGVPDLWVTKEGLASIAASYAPEFVAGSNAKDAYGRDSGFARPPHFDVPPGIDPAFYLNPEDIYKFLHGFGDQDERFDPPHDYSAALRRRGERALQHLARAGGQGAQGAPGPRRVDRHHAHLRQPERAAPAGPARRAGRPGRRRPGHEGPDGEADDQGRRPDPGWCRRPACWSRAASRSPSSRPAARSSPGARPTPRRPARRCSTTARSRRPSSPTTSCSRRSRRPTTRGPTSPAPAARRRPPASRRTRSRRTLT